MGRGTTATPVEAVVEEEAQEPSATPPDHDNGDGTSKKSALTETDVEFIKELVTLFFQEQQQGLEQRIVDLEQLIGDLISRPKSALPQMFAEGAGEGAEDREPEIPWYQPGRV